VIQAQAQRLAWAFLAALSGAQQRAIEMQDNSVLPEDLQKLGQIMSCKDVFLNMVLPLAPRRREDPFGIISLVISSHDDAKTRINCGKSTGRTTIRLLAMGFISFWLVSTVFYLTFPLSLGLCLLVMGRHRTKQLIRALVHDFLQTIFILTVVVVLISLGSMAFSVTLIWRVNMCDLVQGDDLVKGSIQWIR
jgi:hypothetical protein